MQFGIELLSIKKSVSNILQGRLLQDQVSTVRKEELEVVLLCFIGERFLAKTVGSCSIYAQLLEIAQTKNWWDQWDRHT